jgi:hypothetical protein
MYINNKMKHTFFIVAFLFSSYIFAQEKETPYFYVQMSFYANSASPSLDYGQIRCVGREDFTTILNEKGETKFFYTQIDAVNFMSSNGWDIFSVHPKDGYNYGSSIDFYNAYLLRKRATEADKKWLYNLTHKNKLP